MIIAQRLKRRLVRRSISNTVRHHNSIHLTCQCKKKVNPGQQDSDSESESEMETMNYFGPGNSRVVERKSSRPSANLARSPEENAAASSESTEDAPPTN